MTPIPTFVYLVLISSERYVFGSFSVALWLIYHSKVQVGGERVQGSAHHSGFPCSSVRKESACNAGGSGSIPGSGRSPREGTGNPLQYACLRNPMDRGAWQATVHGAARVQHDLATKPPPPLPTTHPHFHPVPPKCHVLSCSVSNTLPIANPAVRPHVSLLFHHSP